MWVFLSNSFLSIVAHEKKKDVLMVRARVKGDIEAVFPNAKVTNTSKKRKKGNVPFDYAFRAEIDRHKVAGAILAQVARIDYPNFKSSVTEQDRHHEYLRVWDVMSRWQDWLTKEGYNS